MKGIHVAFFTEAGYSRGMGHIIRSFAISEKFVLTNYHVVGNNKAVTVKSL